MEEIIKLLDDADAKVREKIKDVESVTDGFRHHK